MRAISNHRTLLWGLMRINEHLDSTSLQMDTK